MDPLGHILRKVYNCRERKNFRPPNILKFPVKKTFHFIKICQRPFLVIYQKCLDIPSIFLFHPRYPFYFSISSTKSSDDFLVISSISYVFHPFQTLQVQLHNQLFASFILKISPFHHFFYAFPLFQLKIYNYNCTIPILHLQTTFYNCTNSLQLHIKICPVLYSLCISESSL